MEKMKYSLALLFLLSSLGMKAQQELNLTFGVDITSLPKYHYAQGGDVLGSSGGADGAISTSLQYRAFRCIGIEGGLQFSTITLGVRDKAFTDRTKDKYDGDTDDPGYFSLSNWYFTPHATLYGYIPLNPKKGLYGYVASGIQRNILLSDPNRSEGTYYSDTGEQMWLTSTFTSRYTSYYVEAGINVGYLGGSPFYMGLKYNINNTQLLQGDYSNVQNGTEVASDHVVGGGNTISFTIRSGLTLWHKASEQHKHLYKPQKQKTPKQASASIDKISTPQDTIAAVGGRTTVVKHTVHVKSMEVTIQIWDHETVDGDVLSLNLNDAWILQKYSLQKERKTMHTQMSIGTNYLTMYADNMGKYSPCTAAILIDDGFSQQMIILDSNMNSSSVIEIIVGD